MNPREEAAPFVTRVLRLRRRPWAWLACAAIVLVTASAVRVTIASPRVHVRWGIDVTDAARSGIEARYGLRNGRRVDERTWRYDLGDASRENIRALVQDPTVADTAYLNRSAFSAEPADVRISLWYPYNDLFDSPSHLIQLHPSLWLLIAGGTVLWASRGSRATRRNLTVAAMLVVGVAALAFPLDPASVTMGGSGDHAGSRVDFEAWFAGRVRFEKHLSQVILLQTYLGPEPTETAPARAMIALASGATASFVLGALTIGLFERWSALVLRYLGLVLLAPASILYFGWREFGYLSLSVAAFPLLERGFRDGGWRVEAGSACGSRSGVARRGTGVAVGGVARGAVGSAAAERAARAGASSHRVGHGILSGMGGDLRGRPEPAGVVREKQTATLSPWRPWIADEIREGRVAAAILSATGARDLSMASWIVGVPLIAVALSLRRQYPHEVRACLWYLVPSLAFVIIRWRSTGSEVGWIWSWRGFRRYMPWRGCAHTT